MAAIIKIPLRNSVYWLTLLKAGDVGSAIQKLTSYPVAVAGAGGYKSPIFLSKNSNNNGVNIGETRNTGITLIQEPKADHCDNSNSNNANTDGKNIKIKR
jgi:hypothetical protein